MTFLFLTLDKTSSKTISFPLQSFSGTIQILALGIQKTLMSSKTVFLDSLNRPLVEFLIVTIMKVLDLLHDCV